MAELTTEVEDAPVAFLDVYWRDFEQGEEIFTDTGESLCIHRNEEFHFGRAKACHYQLADDPVISNKHLQIRCIIFEEDASSNILPLIYVEDFSTNGTYMSNSTDQSIEYRLGRNNGGVLLREGDCLRVSPNTSLRFFYSPRLPFKGQPGLSPVQQRETESFKNKYIITKQKVGSGGHGDVFVATQRKSNRQVACKVVDLLSFEDKVSRRRPLAKLNKIGQRTSLSRDSASKAKRQFLFEEQRRRILKDPQFREFDILKDLDHPNIVRLEKVFWSHDTLYIFQELVTGGDLFSFVEFKGGRLSDVDAAVVLRQVLKAVDFLHDKDIAHRDLKPDNILMTSRTDGARVILTDFGSARRLTGTASGEENISPGRQRMFTVVGTVEYAAPEIHKKNATVRCSEGYSKTVDMWSVGIIATMLLTGDVIFTNRTDPRYKIDSTRVVLGLSAQCDLSVLDDRYSAWQSVGKRPKEFIRKLLVLDETQRMTVKHALAHEWFTNRYHADELEALYQRSIEDWVPRRKVFRIVEPLDLSGDPAKSADSIHEDHFQSTKSPFFSTPQTPHPMVHDTSPIQTHISTPFPSKSDEVITPDPQGSNKHQSRDHAPVAQVFGMQNGMKLLNLPKDPKPSKPNTDTFMAEDHDVEHHSDHDNSFYQLPETQFSMPAGPPLTQPSAGLLKNEIVFETPPSNLGRISSPLSNDLDDLLNSDPILEDEESMDFERTSGRAQAG